MKLLLLTSAACLSLCVTGAANAQMYRPQTGYPCYPAPPIYVASPHHASTVLESHARGYAAMVQAQAQYNLLSSVAALNMAEARRREMENHVTRVQTHFVAREINKSHRHGTGRAARASAEVNQVVASRPSCTKPVTTCVHSDRVAWPAALQDPVFAPHRNTVDQILRKAKDAGSVSREDEGRLTETSRAMVEQLKKRVHCCSPQEFVDAKLVLKALPESLKSNG